jgi:hypothetical protein
MEVTKEMNALQREISFQDERVAAAQLHHGGVVTDPARSGSNPPLHRDSPEPANELSLGGKHKRRAETVLTFSAVDDHKRPPRPSLH